MTGVGSSGRKPYGGRAHQSHCSCSYELDRLRAELQAREATVLRMEAVVSAAEAGIAAAHNALWPARDFVSHSSELCEHQIAVNDAIGFLEAVPRRAGTGEVVGRVHRLPDADASPPRGFGNVPPPASPEPTAP